MTLHRVDTRTGSGSVSGPVDSIRTAADGRYAFHYAGMMNDSILYFIMTTYGGIAYPSALREAHVSGQDGEITVFDTTSGPLPIHVRGRHLVVTGPRAGRDRIVLEAFELSNDSTLTVIPRVVGRDSQPVWSTHLPPGASDVRIDPAGIEGTVAQRGDQIVVFSPMSPGLRQLRFTYTLAPDKFPLAVPLERPTELLEVLIQEPTGTVSGGGTTEVAAQSSGGQTFRRFLAQDLAADAVIQLTVPAPGESISTKVIRVVTSVMGGLMLLAIGVAFGRRQRPSPAVIIDPIDVLLREMATIDAKFEQAIDPTAERRADYEKSRASLKTRLVGAIGGPRR